VAAVLGVLHVRLGIFEALSLKDKRRVTRSLKDRLAHRHNISIAEVDELDQRQTATLALAMVANDARFVDSALRKIVDEIRAFPHASLVDFDIEIL
jgi:uncharacterized protein YlxP (DUF503 family)